MQHSSVPGKKWSRKRSSLDAKLQNWTIRHPVCNPRRWTQPHLSDSDPTAQHSPALPVQTNCEQLLCPSCHLLPAAVHRCALWSHGDYCYLQWSRCKRANIQKLKRIHIKSTQKHSKALYLSDPAMQTTALQKVDVQNLSKASQVIQIWLRYHYHARVSWTPSVLTVASEETISKRMSSLQRSHWWDLGSSCSEPE